MKNLIKKFREYTDSTNEDLVTHIGKPLFSDFTSEDVALHSKHL